MSRPNRMSAHRAPAKPPFLHCSSCVPLAALLRSFCVVRPPLAVCEPGLACDPFSCAPAASENCATYSAGFSLPYFCRRPHRICKDRLSSIAGLPFASETPAVHTMILNITSSTSTEVDTDLATCFVYYSRRIRLSDARRDASMPCAKEPRS
jgi:hypothetical protein